MSTVRTHPIIVRERARRDEAHTLLRVLLDTKAASERHLSALRVPGTARTLIGGRSSIENAVDSAERLLDAFDRRLSDLERTLTDDDLALLAEIEATHAAKAPGPAA